MLFILLSLFPRGFDAGEGRSLTGPSNAKLPLTMPKPIYQPAAQMCACGGCFISANSDHLRILRPRHPSVTRSWQCCWQCYWKRTSSSLEC